MLSKVSNIKLGYLISSLLFLASCADDVGVAPNPEKVTGTTTREKEEKVEVIEETPPPSFSLGSLEGGQICKDGSFDFTISIGNPSNLDLQFQWKKNGEPIVGAPNSPTYSLSLLQDADEGAYSVEVTAGDLSKTSNEAELIVADIPVLLSQPSNLTTNFATPEITLSAMIQDAITYQWYKDGNPINEATSASLTINNVEMNDGGTYRVRGINACGMTDSNDATVTVVCEEPTITQQPQSANLSVGQDYNLMVMAMGATSYQWYKDGSPISGATGTSFTITDAREEDAGIYKVRATHNVCGSTDSNDATITFMCPLPEISAQPQSGTIDYGENYTFLTTVSGADSYQWYKDGTPIDGANSTSLDITNAQISDEGTYKLRATHNVCGYVESDNAELEVHCPLPEITLHPNGATIDVGEDYTLEAAATGATSYQWYKDGSPIAGATGTSFPIMDAQLSDAGSYKMRATHNVCGYVETDPANIIVECPLPEFTQQPASQSLDVGETINLMTVVTGADSFQWFKDGSPVANATGQNLTILNAQTSDSGSYRLRARSNLCGDSYSNVAQVDVVCAYPTITNQPDSVSVLFGDPATFTVEANDAAGYQWYYNGTPIQGATSNTYTVADVDQGDVGTYWVLVYSPNPSVCPDLPSYHVNLDAYCPMPDFVDHPEDTYAEIGGTATFHASAENAESYQWYHSGTGAIPGATSTTLTINDVQEEDVGNYYLMATRTCGSVTNTVSSNAAWLRIPCLPEETISDGNELVQMKPDVNYRLLNDINLSGFVDFEPIANYHCTFDGQGHRIIDAPIQNGDIDHIYLGLFSQTEHSSVMNRSPIIKNLILENPTVTADIVVRASGALVGRASETTIENVSIDGGFIDGRQMAIQAQDKGLGGIVGIGQYLRVRNSDSSAFVFTDRPASIQTAALGGLIGMNRCSVEIDNSHVLRNDDTSGLPFTPPAQIAGSYHTGGLIGYNIQITSDNQNCASEANGNISRSSSVADVAVQVIPGTYFNPAVGGLVGVNSSSSIQDSFANNSVSGSHHVGGLVGSMLTGSSIENSYSASFINSFSTNRGGLVGNATGSVSFTGSFWNTTINSGLDSNQGGIGNLSDPNSVTGITSSQMQTESTFTNVNWDFDTIWMLDSAQNDGFPVHQ